MSEFGNFIKSIRGKMTLREAAKRSGLSHSYISSMENDRHPTTGGPVKPSPDTLRQLSKAYDYPYEDLMKMAGYLEGDTEMEAESYINQVAAQDLIDFLTNKSTTIDGEPIPQEFIDDIVGYVRIRMAMDKDKKMKDHS